MTTVHRTWILSLCLSLVCGIFCLIASPVQSKECDYAQLQQRFERITSRYADFHINYCIYDINANKIMGENYAEPSPLASVFKIPVMIEACRQMENRELNLNLNSRLTIRNIDKCIGSGQLQKAANGSQINVDKTITLMETVSDNTATDLIFHTIGTASVRKLMKNLNLHDSDIFMTNRQAWILSLRKTKEFRGCTPERLVVIWKGMTPAQRYQAAQAADREFADLPLKTLQNWEDASYKTCSMRQNMQIAAVVDNMGSAQDFAKLMGQLWKGQILSSDWTKYCFDVLAQQKYNSRIPRLLPKGTKVYHKTGTLTGIINDAGLLMSRRQRPIAVAVFIQNVNSGREDAAQELIGRLSKAAWEEL